MAMRRIWVRTGLAAAVLAVLASVGWYAWTARALPAAGHRFTPGTRLVYRLEHASVASSDFGRALEGTGLADLAGLKRSVRTATRGELVMVVLRNDGKRVELAYRLGGPEVSLLSDGIRLADEEKQVGADLERWVFVEADPSGRIDGLRPAPGMKPLSVGFVRSMLSASQVVLPGGADGKAGHWEAEEEDPSGRGVARYERADDNPGATWTLHKTRLRYRAAERDPADGEDAALAVEPGGRLVARVDLRRGRLTSLAGTETATVSMQNKEVASTETTLSLELLREEAMDEEALQRLKGLSQGRAVDVPAVSLTGPEGTEAGEAAVQRAELGDETVGRLLAELEKAEKAEKAEVNETGLYLKFKALVYLQPGTAARLGEHLKKAKAQSVALRVLPQALAESGRPRAQLALVAAVRARQEEWPAMSLLLPTLGFVKQPVPEIDGVLDEIARKAPAEETRTTAQLALGGLAQTLAKQAPRRAEAIVDWALQAMAAARSPAEKRQMLLVLGNTAAAPTLPVIRRHLGDPDVGVRGAAVAALRWHPGEEVDGALCKALTGDGDAVVRQEAANAFEVRKMTPAAVAAHRKAFKDDVSGSVRLAVLGNLAKVRKQVPEVQRLIEQAAKGDPSREVKEQAQALLDEGK